MSRLAGPLRAALLILVGLVWASTLVVRVSDVVADRHQSMGIYVEEAPDDTLVITAHSSGAHLFNNLEVGDRIVRVGLAAPPDSQLDFHWAFLQAKGRVTIERDGHVLEVQSPLEQRAGGAMAVVTTVLFGLLGGLLGVFGDRKAGTVRPALLAFLAGITTGASPNGPTPEVLAWCIYAQVIASSLIGPLLINWIQWFVLPEARWTHRTWPWAFAAMGPAVYSVYLGAPIPSPIALWITAAIPILICIAFAAIGLSRYSRLTQEKRTQLNWLIAGVCVYTFCTLGLAVISSLLDQPFMFIVGQSHLGLIIAVAFGMAILKADFGNIDRAVSVTVTYATLMVVFALLVEFVVEPLAGLVSTSLGLPESTGQTVLIVALALGAPTLKRLVEPRVRAFFAPRGQKDG